MDEKVLLDWKNANEEVYSKFKQDLEEQLLKPYHQTILDLGDGNAELLQSVIANLYAVSSKDGFDIEKLYSKTIQSGEVSAYCLCCYLQFDYGAEHLAKVLAEKSEEPGAKEIIDAIAEYKRLFNNFKHQETAEITSNELNVLTLRRWHYDHPQEYSEFTALFQKAYDGDMTFAQNNFFILMEMMSFNGVKGMMKIVASLFPGNKHYEQSLSATESNPLKERLESLLDSSLNDSAIRERLLHKNPYLFSIFYWLVFDNGFLHAADLISHNFLNADAPYWERQVGRRAVEALINTSIDKAHYSKSQWKEMSQKIKKGEEKQVINSVLIEAQSRRGRKKTFVLLEELLMPKYADVLAKEIQDILFEWKKLDDTDTILAFLFAALVGGKLTSAKYNYRTFHAAMREKFPDSNINIGYDWGEALYNAIMSEDFTYNISVSDAQIKRGRKYVTDIKLRLLSVINPNIK
mgnify:FL=1